MSKYLSQIMIALLLALLAAGYYWAKETTLDLITRGEGRLIAEGQNKLVQAPSGGVVTDIFVTDGDTVKSGQLLAMINSTAAEGSLEEIVAKKNSLLAKIIRLDAELKNKWGETGDARAFRTDEAKIIDFIQSGYKKAKTPSIDEAK